ncbi:hypothetical protein GCM10020220_060290 [Nonomuraea rubra]|uniref:exo-beta-N-acetylmuramidase NamZ domain-containing protein n=1 Tax=Nonomuraea rubra TaxID=46180 RepID=UPI0031E7D410
MRGTDQAAGDTRATPWTSETGLPVYDTYQLSGEALTDVVAAAGVDTLVFDIADVGARFTTTSGQCTMMESDRHGLACVSSVWTGRNPRRTVEEGPPLDPAFASFVASFPLPLRHGRTVGETGRAVLARRDLTVVTMRAGRREMSTPGRGLPWVMLGSIMRHTDTALSTRHGLVEGTTSPRGAATTRPFRADRERPYGRRAARARAGVSGCRGCGSGRCGSRRRSTSTQGVPVRGCSSTCTTRDRLQAVLTWVYILHVARTLYPEDLRWHRGPTVPGPPVGVRHPDQVPGGKRRPARGCARHRQPEGSLLYG